MEYHHNIELINVKNILLNPYNMTAMSNNTYESLKKGISENGFIGAITVRVHPLKKGKYEIIDGEKRFKALKELGEDSIPCIILDYNDINTTINMIKLNREHGYFDKEKTTEVLDDLIKKTNKLFIREILHCNLKEFDDLLNDNEQVFSEDKVVDTSKYTNILQESEKSKRLFY